MLQGYVGALLELLFFLCLFGCCVCFFSLLFLLCFRFVSSCLLLVWLCCPLFLFFRISRSKVVFPFVSP